MNSFKDFNIKPRIKGFEGDKINIDRVLNRNIVVHDYAVKDSTKKANEKCLHLSISVDGDKRLIFTGSKRLMDMVQQVPEDGFPFQTIIIKENGGFKFS